MCLIAGANSGEIASAMILSTVLIAAELFLLTRLISRSSSIRVCGMGLGAICAYVAFFLFGDSTVFDGFTGGLDFFFNAALFMMIGGSLGVGIVGVVHATPLGGIIRLGARISPTSSRLLIAVTCLFVANAFIKFADSIEFLPSITQFFEYPFVFTSLLVAAIWLALGRHHLVLRLSFSLLMLVGLFFLSCIDWLSTCREPWDQFGWIGFLGGAAGALMVVTVPAILLATTVPLLIHRYRSSRSDDNTASRLSLRYLLASTGCWCITLAMGVGLTPYSSWLVEFAREAIRFVGEPISFVVIIALPSFTYVAIAYAALACWGKLRGSLVATAGLSLAVSFVLAVCYSGISSVAWEELSYRWRDVIYMTGQNVLTLFLLLATLNVMEPSLAVRAAQQRTPAEIRHPWRIRRCL